MMQKSPMERAIELAGSEAKLGRATGYSQVAINKAKHKERPSAEMAVAIERAVGVPRHELRPDIFEKPAA